MTATIGERPADAPVELMDAAIGGDREAFGQLYDRYHDVVFRFVFRRVGNRHLAEDLAADTFARALARVDGFTWQGRDPGAWLVTIARNLVADHYKSKRYQLEVTVGDILDADREDRDAGTSPEAATVAAEARDRLYAALAELTADQQRAVRLRYLVGLSAAETAQVTRATEGAVKSLTYRAMCHLRRLVPDLGTAAEATPEQEVPA